MGRGPHIRLVVLAILGLAVATPLIAFADDEMEAPVARTYAVAPSAVQGETQAEADAKSAGCKSCHTTTDAMTMHETPAVVLGCADCHGGDAHVTAPPGLKKTDAEYAAIRDRAHGLPRYPQAWNYPSSAKPKGSYTLLNRESPEFVRFVNPSDFRVARETCGSCHAETVEASLRSMHATGVMLWGGASYNNGILDAKNYFLGESYTREGIGAAIKGPVNIDPKVTFEASILPVLCPLPAWETVKPGDIFRIFERGGRNIGNVFSETGLPDAN